jgi:hypothetical protein
VFGVRSLQNNSLINFNFSVMRKILFFLLVVACNVARGQLTPIMYFPNSASYTDPTKVQSIPGMQGWYQNLQKYWYYRYRLVNDFLFISETNEAGSSIPAQQRTQGAGWNEQPIQKPESAGGCGQCNTLKWSDATIDLGHYIQAMAAEENLLWRYARPTSRSKYELKHALDAFDRLDDNAEQYEHDVNYNVGPSHGYPGTLSGYTYPLSDRHNGYVIRDDVPSLTIVDSTWPGNRYKHFNRPGLKRTWTYPCVSPAEDYDHMNRAAGAFARQWDEQYHNIDGNCRWEGTIGTHTVIHNWGFGSVPRFPTQESTDQLLDLQLGMALVCEFSLDMGLQSQAADALFRSVKFPFSSYVPHIIDPVITHCVYGIDPGFYNASASCNKGGAEYSAVALGGAEVADIYAGPWGHATGALVTQANVSVVPVTLFSLAAGAALTMSSSPCSKGDQAFAAYYACLTNSWGILGVNTTWKSLKAICNKTDWGRPQLPLIYELINNPPENYRHFDYENALNAAPPCGPYNFSGFRCGDGGPRPFWDEMLTGDLNKIHWTGNDWISEPQHRWNACNADGSRDGSKMATYNGLDYMVLFDLFCMKQGLSYLKNVNNPYWDDDYRINYPDNKSFGSSSLPLFLNFLEYAALKGNYGTNSNVSIRGGKQIELAEGFDSKPNCDNCFTDIYIKDYGCRDDPDFTFAWVKDLQGARIGESEEEDVALYNPGEIVPPNDSLMLADSLITPEMEKHFFDSLVLEVIHIGDSSAVDIVRGWGVNVDSIMASDTTGMGARGIRNETNVNSFPVSFFKVDVYPNPAHGAATVGFDLPVSADVQIVLTNTVGQEFNQCIQPYDSRQRAGKHTVSISTEQLTPGMYYVRIQIGSQLVVKKLTVL